MASAKKPGVLSELNICPICLEEYNTPRSIPACRHSFCENCLFTFVFNLKEKGELGIAFECPVCRRAQSIPESGCISMDWIKTFPAKEIGVTDDQKPEDEVEEPSRYVCGPCGEEGVSIPGKKYCVECQENLCDSCVTSHTKFKQLKTHKLTDMDDATKQKVISEFDHLRKCPKHPDREIELFCKCEEIPLCLKCAVTGHKTCKSDVDIAEYENELKDMASGLKARFKSGQEHLSKSKEISSQAVSAFHERLDTFQKDVNDIRDEVIASISGIAEQVVARAAKISTESDKRLANESKRLQQMIEFAQKRQSLLTMLIERRSFAELLSALEKMQIELEEFEENLNQEDENATETTVELPLMEDLRKISTELSAINVVFNVVNKLQNRPKYIETQCMPTTYDTKRVAEHKVRPVKKCSPTYSNISIQEDGLMVMCDNYGSPASGFICIYDTYEKNLINMKMARHYCATFTEPNTIAVSIPGEKSIAILSLRLNMKQVKCFQTQSKPKGLVALKNGTLAVSWDDPPAFSITDISGSELKNLEYLTHDSNGRKFNSFDYLAIDERRKRVFQSCKKDTAVYCFGYSGTPVFEYKHDDLKSPRGIAVYSANGNVFVCDEESDCVHHLSAAGRPMHIIRDLGISKPLAICYDKSRCMFWLSHSCWPHDTIYGFKQIIASKTK